MPRRLRCKIINPEPVLYSEKWCGKTEEDIPVDVWQRTEIQTMIADSRRRKWRTKDIIRYEEKRARLDERTECAIKNPRWKQKERIQLDTIDKIIDYMF